MAQQKLLIIPQLKTELILYLGRKATAEIARCRSEENVLQFKHDSRVQKYCESIDVVLVGSLKPTKVSKDKVAETKPGGVSLKDIGQRAREEAEQENLPLRAEINRLQRDFLGGPIRKEPQQLLIEKLMREKKESAEIYAELLNAE